MSEIEPRRRWFRFGPTAPFLAATLAGAWLGATTHGCPPQSADTYVTRGVTWLEKRDYDSAIKDFTEAIRLSPKNAASYNYRGVAWKYKGQFENMIRDYSEAIRIDPNFAEAYHNWRCDWRGKKQYDKAIEDFTEAILWAHIDGRFERNQAPRLRIRL